MRRHGEFFRKILAGPVFIVFAIAPEPAVAYVIYNAFVSNPYFRFVLSVAQG